MGSADGGIIRRKVESQDHIWSVDIIFDRTINGRFLKMLVVIDEFTRECLALDVGRKFTGEHLVEVLIDLFAIRRVPKFLRSDNAPEFVSRRVRNFLESIDVGTSYIKSGSPWQNGFVEIFNSRFRDKCLNCKEFATAL
ncbi:DDE-type integrase/transposase/recombinase [Pseudomonadales bacterium]|nr:DDE-type integrase/transposase/recombinase [Pseudomonadales bacterium]